jgi:hypothetical protein
LKFVSTVEFETFNIKIWFWPVREKERGIEHHTNDTMDLVMGLFFSLHLSWLGLVRETVAEIKERRISQFSHLSLFFLFFSFFITVMYAHLFLGKENADLMLFVFCF